MASSSLPDGWELLGNPTWGTEATREETTTYSGGHAVRIKGTFGLRTPPFPIPASPFNASLGVWLYVYPTSVTANDYINLQLRIYDKDGTELTNFSLFDQPARTANAWNIVGGSIDYNPESGGCFGRVDVEFGSDNTKELIVDSVICNQIPPCGEATGTVSALAQNTWTPVAVTAGSILALTSEIDVTTPGSYPSVASIEIRIPGIYIVTAHADFTAISNGKFGDIQLWTTLSGLSYVAGNGLHSSQAHGPNNHAVGTWIINALMYESPGGGTIPFYIWPEVYTDDPGTPDVDVDIQCVRVGR